MEESNPELESFRQQWRAEVSAKAKEDIKPRQKSNALPPRRFLVARRPSAARIADNDNLEDDYIDDRPLLQRDIHVATEVAEEAESSKTGSREPRSALEHYEKAVERETQGNLGDSLNLYRKAFRLDHRVDQKYKNKHFPPSSLPSKPANPNPSNAAATVPNTAHHSLDGPPKTIKQLIAGFSGLSIKPAPPAIEGAPVPPCPLANLPDEIVIHILTELAILDIASFVRLAQVCKRLAYLVATEEQIWKRVCEGTEVGFGAMHYQFQCEVLGGPLEEYPELDGDELRDGNDNIPAVIRSAPLYKSQITEELLHSTYSSSWHQMFRLRPRIRFNGCYISTVNYIRPGQASASQVTWISPVHIVTYYRYLRFFRDGTVISLLTTTEPADVVHHLTKELADAHRNGGAAHLPSVVMQNALRGRWCLSTISDNPEGELRDSEGDVIIETEGVGPKYIYLMELSLRSSGKGAKNNKLVWNGFWSYNKLTDDRAEFTLRNDKAFFWSRVRSYGTGA